MVAVEVDAGLEAEGLDDEAGVLVLAQPLDIDADLAEQSQRYIAVVRVLEKYAAAEREVALAGVLELISFGAPAEIIVVVENQDARVLVRSAIEMGRRESADAPSDDDEVVALVDVRGVPPLLAIPGALVGDLEGAAS